MTSRPSVRVLIVDDHPAVRSGLARLVADAAELQVVASEATAHDALTAARRLRVDVAVVDYRLPDDDGLALAHDLKGLPRPPRVLIYSAYADHVLGLAAIIAGADGTLSKSTVGEDLVRAIVAMAAGRTQHPDPPPSVARAVAQHVDERDLPILAMLVDHVPPAEIAEALQISQGWLEARRWAMLQRIVRSTNVAHRRGLTDEPPGVTPSKTDLRIRDRPDPRRHAAPRNRGGPSAKEPRQKPNAPEPARSTEDNVADRPHPDRDVRDRRA